ncbi:MAG: diadenylate cyclase CdaA [Clostridia bacterium]|nr:diadenylate cyclase CdaA [Clostridia bacterium]
MLNNFYENNIAEYFASLQQYPIKLVTLIVDLGIVIFLGYKLLQVAKDTRAWQLLKGIVFLIIVTALSGLLKLNILHFILSSLMTYGALLLIVVFQPELRRALEQLGTSKLTKFFGIDKDIATKTRENIYKIVIAVMELAKEHTGALIVIERDIKLKDIVSSGIYMNSDISPQLLVNIFVPNTPLHDGAVIISDNKIAAAACMLPLAGDKDIARELGTRHRAAIGISKESDAIAIVVSEETGKVSIAKDGTLIADLKEDALKKILIKNVITKRFTDQAKTSKVGNLKNKIENKFKKKG